MRALGCLLLACAAASPAPPEPARSLALKLQEVRLSLKLEKATLEEFVKYCRTVAGINIVVNRGLIEKQFDPDALVIDLEVTNARLVDALKLALEPHGLALKIEGNILFITTKKDARGKPVLVVYDVSELLMAIRDFPAPDINVYPSSYEPPDPPEPEIHVAVQSSEELAEMVRQFTGAETWEDEGVRITPFRRHLFIRQYPQVHREIAGFLNQVRSLR
ncbi:MAG: hypothetical protein ACT4PV_05910 [Planctomycetaceae bacterium]